MEERPPQTPPSVAAGKSADAKKPATIFSLLGPYKGQIIFLALLSMATSGLELFVPKIVAHSIDTYIQNTFSMKTLILQLGGVSLLIYVFAYLMSIVQTLASERVGKDVRNSIADKISKQSYAFVEKLTPARILTNLTSDIDSIKTFVGQAISTMISSFVIIVGAAILLLMINWKLGLAVLSIIPVIALLFYFIFRKAGALMKKSREVIDWLNKVINESVLGAALIRVLNSQRSEYDKFIEVNKSAKNTGLGILQMFAVLIPSITFVASLASLVIVVLGGNFVITGAMTLGNFAAFNSYVGILIFPIIMIGVMGSMISQSQASFQRINEVLEAEIDKEEGTITKELEGKVVFKDVDLTYGEKQALKKVSFEIQPRTKTAIIGPTAAGKTQLLHLLTRLFNQSGGEILIDDQPINTYDAPTLHRQVGLVFQDSIIFNLTVRENIAFGGIANEEDMQRAIRTAELSDFITKLPKGLDTVISERGSSLSGGQKQRIMLARALALNPKILLLDDFTARVDTNTEQKILSNVAENYPDLTLISVTQKIASVSHYEKIILLMEGEVVATGTHTELLASSPEYAQINDSQKSTNQYE